MHLYVTISKLTYLLPCEVAIETFFCYIVLRLKKCGRVNMKKRKDIKQIISIFILVIVVLGVILSVTNKELLLAGDEVSYLNEWTYNNETVQMGERLNLNANEPYTIQSTIPENFTDDKRLLLRSSLSKVSVYVDSHLVYTGQINDHMPMASLWHIVNLPTHSEGKPISITYQSPYKRMNGTLNPVVYGQQGDLFYYIFSQYGLAFFIDAIILFIGITLIIVAFLHSKDIYNNIWYIGMLALFMASWLFAESRMLQFITGSQWLLGSLAFICLPIIPIPFLKYIQNISVKKQRSLEITWMACLFILATIILLQFLGISDFFETLWLTHSYYIALIIIVGRHLYKEIKHHNNQEIKGFTISLSLLFGFVLLEIMRFHVFKAENVTVFIRIGLLVYITSLGIKTGKELVTLLKKSYRAEYYERLAYLDQLTQGPNRAAYERDLDKAFSNPMTRDKLRLIILDVNQLKQINDEHGHVSGDEAIQIAYEVINDHFKPLGETYRIGGDEFACIILEGSDLEYNRISQAFLKNISNINQEKPYPFGIAIGSVKYDKDISAKHLMHRADIKMYEFKETKNGIS